MNDPLVSVLMPIYNGERWLRESVESVLSQTYPRIELIMVDDHSTDGSGSLADSFRQNNVKVIHNIKNAGINGSRNIALQSAQGFLIALLDQDDVWFPEKVSEQMALFRADASIDLVYADSYYAEDFTRLSKRSFQMCEPHRGYVYPYMLIKNFMPSLTVLFTRDLLRESGVFDETYWSCADYEFIVRLCRKARVDYVDKPLGIYRVHPGSFTAKNQERQYVEGIRILKSEASAMASKGALLAHDGLTANLYLRIARLSFRRRAFVQACRAFGQGLFHAMKAPYEFLASVRRDWAERQKLKKLDIVSSGMLSD